MKKVLLSLAVVLVTTLSVNAADTEWNFSDWEAGDIATVKTDGILSIYPKASGDTGSNVSIDANNKKLDDYTFTKRLKLGGGGSPSGDTPNLPTARYITLEVAGNATITVYGMSSSGNSLRTLVATDGTNVIGSFSNDGNAIDKYTYNYTGEAATIYLYCLASGFNIYLVKASVNPAGIGETVADKGTIVDEVFYTLLGARVSSSNLEAGQIYLVTTTYDNGLVETTKILK